MELGWLETVAVLGVACALFVWSNAVEKRPVDLNHPRMVSPIMVMGVAVVVAILMLAHMISLSAGVGFRGGGL